MTLVSWANMSWRISSETIEETLFLSEDSVSPFSLIAVYDEQLKGVSFVISISEHTGKGLNNPLCAFNDSR